MDPNNFVLEISSDEDGEWNDHARGVSDGGDDYNWFAELFGKESNGDDDSDAVVVVSESVKKSKVKSCVVDSDDDDDDCVVLDSDPNEPVEVRNDDSGNGADDDSDDVLVVSEKGQVACRDYPHSRHLCIKFPFSTTPNQNHCKQCYCYVCDSLAPCVNWGNGTETTDHCHANDKDEFWVLERKAAKIGCKTIHAVSQPSSVDLHTPVPPLVQPHNQILNPGLIHSHHTPANFQYPNIPPSQYRNNILASRTKLHPDLTSQVVLRAHQKYNMGSRVPRPVFKRSATSSLRAAPTANQNLYSSYRGKFGNLNRQQNYPVSGMLSRSNMSLGSFQIPTDTSSTVNPQPLLRQPVSNHSNLNLPSPVNSNSFNELMCYRQPHQAPPLSFRPQLASGQLSYTVPSQPSYSVPSKIGVNSPIVPALDLSQNFSQGNQAPGLTVDAGFNDNGLGLPAGQDSATLGCTGSANESSMAAVSGGLADIKYDWIFDDQPIEPGFTDYSSDSAFIDTGPIFEF